MTSRNRIFRRISPKAFALVAIGLTVLLCVYYSSYTSNDSPRSEHSAVPDGSSLPQEPAKLRAEPEDVHKTDFLQKVRISQHQRQEWQVCPRLTWSQSDITTGDVFKDFDFQPSWMRSKEYWDKTFEERYERTKMQPDRPPLRVIIVPHSHNDPGWLKTFENYFHFASRQIMNNMVAKLEEYKNLTFIWSEISFLNAWWEEAHPSKQRLLKELIHSGRLEITTGGWVMTDEATSHIFAIVDQLIEGHQWTWANLGVKPKSGWSVDPFGHGSTVPYLLGASGFEGTVIQRIHYAWKQWLALKQYGDFKWVPSWTPSDPSLTLLTHNQPFDIYSIKHSCGPHPYICLNFDFRKVPGEYTEYSLKAQAITEKNVKEKAELLLEQYARTGSLTPHNVILTPLGDDFRYNVKEEWEQQYTNYAKLIDYINQNKHIYKTDIGFGTPKMYFDEILKRYDQFPTLKGDFFVYSDIFSEGRPAYWSGYFTTRPFLKILDRQLEHNLRSAEILYTMSLNYAKQHNISSHFKILEKDYEKLIQARRYLGLFQHHDAITGTSKSFVMKDYSIKLFEALRDTTNIQHHSLQTLIFPYLPVKKGQDMVLSDIERDSYDKQPNRTVIQIGPHQSRKILLFNSLATPQEHVITLIVNTTNVKVQNVNGSDVMYQLNPILNAISGKFMVEPMEYELVFIAKLEELSVTAFNLMYYKDTKDNLGLVYCSTCVKKSAPVPGHTDRVSAPFTIKDIPPGDIQLENQKMKLLFSGSTGFMKSITRKHKPKVMQCQIQFQAYRSAQFHSGSYLFKPDPNEREYEKDVLLPYKDQQNIIITTGPVSTEILTIYGPFLVHKVTIYLDEKSALSDGISIENTVDFESPPKNRETELFMRILSDVQNGEPPEFYTDLNSFSMQKRVKVEKIGIEGNYFPITSMAFIQDSSVRLSLLTDHAQGAASWQPGYLEVMLDRRTLYDDSRGMGEGLVDNKRTTSKYWLLVEDMSADPVKDDEGQARFDGDDTFEKGEAVRSFNVQKQPPTTTQKPETFPRASLYATHMTNSLNYPASVYIVDSENPSRINDSIKFLNKPLPCDVFLLNLRTQPDSVYTQFPSNSALMLLHRQGYDCAVSQNYTCNSHELEKNNYFSFLKVKELELKSLTGLDSISSLDSIGDVFIEPMSLKTLNVTFG